MHLISLLSHRRTFLLSIAISSLVMIAFALLYDYFVQETACIICWMQRVILILLALCSFICLRFRSHLVLSILSVLGLIISIRHTYVLLFPVQVTHCMPFELLLDLPGQLFWKGLVEWISSVGRECVTDVGIVTYVLVPFLFVYYSFILVLGRKVRSERM